jgi:hypothetical protein
MVDMLNEICTSTGIELDSSVVINPAYIVDVKPIDISQQNIIKYIACSHSSCARINRLGKLAFAKFAPTGVAESISYTNYIKIKQTNAVKTITRIVVQYDDEGGYLESGIGDDDHTIKAYNPFITEDMLTTIYNSINGFTYIPFSMDYICFHG